MIVSTKGRYALRVMIDLAEHRSEKYVPLKEVAARQEISEKYLENILKVLVQNGFLEGLRDIGDAHRLHHGIECKPLFGGDKQFLAAFHVTALEERFDDGGACGGSWYLHKTDV